LDLVGTPAWRAETTILSVGFMHIDLQGKLTSHDDWNSRHEK
jgi:hypothetical protein